MAQPQTLAKYIRQLGLVKFMTDTTDYDPSQTTRSRSDAAITLRKTHQAAAYDQWFREQVAQGLKEANDSNTQWVTDKEIAEMSRKKRGAWRAIAKEQQ